MRKIIISPIALLFCGLLINSCVKLDETPPGQLSPGNFYKTVADFEAATNGAIQPLFQSYGGWDFNGPFILCYGAEDLTTRPQATESKTFDELRPTPSNGTLAGMWGMCYSSINNATAILVQLPNATAIPAQKSTEFSGQAKFLRALNYFYLVRWFGKLPLITESNQDIAATVPEAEIAAIYTQIEKDLKEASNELPVSFPEKGRPTKGAAQALLAKVYLTEAGWPLMDNSKYALARDMAKAVIDAGTYKLEKNFADLWLAKNKFSNTEFIFTLTGISTAGLVPASHHHVATRPGEEGGWSDRFTEARFFNAFPSGPRKDASFHTVFDDAAHTTWQNSQYAQPYISKFRDAGAASPFTGPYKSLDGEGFTNLLRYADVLLIYAEAANMAEGAPSATAYEAINKVRRRAQGLDPDAPNASTDLAGLSKADFDKAVIAERNWELAFEGNRWFDLVRKQMVVEVNKALYPYVDAHNMLMPKPDDEIKRLKGLLSQNEGYK